MYWHGEMKNTLGVLECVDSLKKYILFKYSKVLTIAMIINQYSYQNIQYLFLK